MAVEFAETMSGTYALTSAPHAHRRLSFSATARADSVAKFVRTGVARLDGTVTADGLAASAALTGTITILPVRKRLIAYEFAFTGDDGRDYAFVGQKTIRLFNLPGTLTTLPGTIIDDSGQDIATCLVKFDLAADWLPFVTSWRFASG